MPQINTQAKPTFKKVVAVCGYRDVKQKHQYEANQTVLGSVVSLTPKAGIARPRLESEGRRQGV